MSVRSFTEFCFNYEKEIGLAVIEKRLKLMPAALPKTGGRAGGHAYINDTAASAALRNAEGVAKVEIELPGRAGGAPSVLTVVKPEEWLKVVRFTRDYYGASTQGNLIRLRYTEKESVDDVCKKLFVSRKQYFIMRTEVLSFAAGVARGLGLIARRTPAGGM